MYWMLVRSEEKARSLLETTAYALIALCAVVAILQFSEQPDPLPLTSLPGSISPR